MAGQAKTDINQLLADSLKEIAGSHPVEKITIKEITDKNGENRPNNYNQKQNKYKIKK